MPDLDDNELVVLAIKELPYVTSAYEVLAKRHHTLIYRTALGILRNKHDAEDAAQTALIKVFNGLPSFEQRASFKTWLIRIVTNTCFTIAKKRQRDAENQSRFPDSDESEGEGTSPETDIHTPFDDIIEKLDAEEKQILTLRFISELSLNEIAEVMNLGLSAVKMRHYRALDKLKKHYS